jgi:hypothetical protein
MDLALSEEQKMIVEMVGSSSTRRSCLEEHLDPDADELPPRTTTAW